METLFKNALHVMADWNSWMTANDDVKSMWKKALLAYCKRANLHLPGVQKKITKAP
jgi:hypothetical protein